MKIPTEGPFRYAGTHILNMSSNNNERNASIIMCLQGKNVEKPVN